MELAAEFTSPFVGLAHARFMLFKKINFLNKPVPGEQEVHGETKRNPW
jgi:hypothetical protein